jgi:hypothetical protein
VSVIAKAKKKSPKKVSDEKAALVAEGIKMRSAAKKMCMSCPPGRALQPLREFYTSYSTLHADGKLPICKTCIMEKCYDDNLDDVDLKAFKSILQQMDRPWIESAWDGAIRQYNDTYTGKNVPSGNRKALISYYMKNISMRQFRAMSWNESIDWNARTKNARMIEEGKVVEGGYIKAPEKEKSQSNDNMPEREPTRWRGADLKNRNYVISTIGYDCFLDDSYTDANRKFLFNTLADYLTDDVIEDPHKLQCVIMMVKTTLQVDGIDKLINRESLGTSHDYDLIKKLSSVKRDLASNINSIANENGISAKTSGKSGKHANALTYIMKEMAENNFDEIKVNIVDVKMSESYKEVATQNAKALFSELNYTSDEYARLLAEQSVKYGDAQDRITELEEQVRLLRIELATSKDVGKK